MKAEKPTLVATGSLDHGDKAGVDYGLGRTNIDLLTGIRYGVISQHSVGQAWYDDAVPIFPEDANGDLVESDSIGLEYKEDGYYLEDCLDSDIMVIKSPFYTFAAFCSPCVPGAGDLDQPVEGGVKTYCLGHDWFETSKAPYDVYDVKTGQLITAQVDLDAAHETRLLKEGR